MAGRVGGPPGLSEGGFGGVGEAAVCFQTMAQTMKHMREIIDNVEAHSINVEKHVRELSLVMMDLTKACGRMFEQAHLRFVAMFSATRTCGGRSGGFHKDVMEHQLIMNLWQSTETSQVFDGGTKSSQHLSDKLEVHTRT